MHPTISSAQNPKIKDVLALEKSRERKIQHRFVIEGVMELTLAVGAGYSISSLFFCPEIASPSQLEGIVPDMNIWLPVTESVFEKMAYRGASGGVIAIAETRNHTLEKIQLSANPLVLVLEAVEKPGNLGALLRTADAAGLDAVIICDPLTDFYNPNVIRSSVGCVFTNQLAAATSVDALKWLKDQQLQIICTSLQAAVPYHTIHYNRPSCIVMGTESTGLSHIWTDQSDHNIIIPMRGKIDSMNVSNAAAIVVFEALRQRDVELTQGID